MQDADVSRGPKRQRADAEQFPAPVHGSTPAGLQSVDGRRDDDAAMHAGSLPGEAAPRGQSHSSASTASRDAGSQEVRPSLQG